MDSTSSKYPVAYNTLLTPFDLAAQITAVGDPAGGDFLWTPTPCANGDSDGCLFPASGSNLSTVQYFATRFRGFILIPASIAGLPFHIGFRSKTVVALRVFDKTPKLYELISRASGSGAIDYRVTNTITFKNAGLYPIEIVHANGDSVALLEMSIRFDNVSTWTDIDDVSDTNTPLSGHNFLQDSPRPEQSTSSNRFFQTVTGVIPFDGHPDQCQQCPRSYAGVSTQPVNGTVCQKGMFCNEAAVCAPCIGDQFCGSSCKICAGTSTPFCVRDPDAIDYDCVQCVANTDCLSGQTCVNHTCQSVCNCCPNTPFCLSTDNLGPAGAKNCSECRTDTDCPNNGKCDLINARCVAALPQHNTDDHCGDNDVNCITSTANDPAGPRPKCMDGQVCVQCRYDVDCPATNYCLSGSCVPCTHDRHCGASCQACGFDYAAGPNNTVISAPSAKPYCLSPSSDVTKATCVQCLTDANCGSGTCDPGTKTCVGQMPCSMTCVAGEYCNGGNCVQCVTSSQCPCGACIDGTCTPNCGDTTDCHSNQCCATATGTCTDTRCEPDLHAGAGLCCTTSGSSIGVAHDPIAPTPSGRPLLIFMTAAGLLAAMRLRWLLRRQGVTVAGGGRE